MKRQYEEMELELISFQHEDVITTSGQVFSETKGTYSLDCDFNVFKNNGLS